MATSLNHFGNFVQRAVLPSGQSVITSTCTVETPDEIAVNPEAAFTLVQNLPDEALHIYGMNFEFMPELGWRFGYGVAVGTMAVVCSGLWFGFKRSGWL